MIELVFKIYRLIFARSIFFKLNKFLYRCSMSGMGVLNYQSDSISGEAGFLSEYLSNKDNPVVFDIGANTGKYSQLLLRHNPASVIYAFEPHPITCQKLVTNLQQTGVHTINAAVGATDGELTLFDYASHDGSEHASLHREVIEGIRGAQSSMHRVKVTSLDTFAQEHHIDRIDLLKIDTEGHELAVLQGAAHLLKHHKIRAIQFEFNEMNVASRSFFKDFWDLLGDYDLYRLLPDGKVRIDTYSAVYCEIFAFQNIVALHHGLQKRS